MLNEEMSSPFYKVRSTVLYEIRYCSQDEYNIVVCGGKDENWDVTNEVREIKGPDFQKFSEMTPMVKPRMIFINTAVVGSDLYVFGGDRDKTCSFEIYSAKTKDWKELKLPKPLKYYSVCSFMKSVYIIGGSEKDYSFEMRYQGSKEGQN